jgi:hypothetical protein
VKDEGSADTTVQRCWCEGTLGMEYEGDGAEEVFGNDALIVLHAETDWIGSRGEGA